MFTYFLLFTIVGAIAANVIQKIENVGLAYLVIALIWASIHGPFWGLVSFGELWVGFLALKLFSGKT